MNPFSGLKRLHIQQNIVPLGTHNHLTYCCSPRVHQPGDLWLHKWSSRKDGRRGCFRDKRASLLGRNNLFMD